MAQTAKGTSDILWNFGSSTPVLWQMNNAAVTNSGFFGGPMPVGWHIAGVGDFNGDGMADVLWAQTNGPAALWLTQANGKAQGVSLTQYGTIPGKAWIGDFDGDGKSDILWDFGSAPPVLWKMNGGTVTSSSFLGGPMPAGWAIAGVGDFNGDGRADVLWAQPNGEAALWLTQANGQVQGVSLAQYGGVPGKAWIGDFDGDGKSDILWDRGSAAPVLWKMNGGIVTSNNVLGGQMPTGWAIAGVGDFNGDGRADVLWAKPDGPAALWLTLANGQVQGVSLAQYGAIPGQAVIGNFLGQNPNPGNQNNNPQNNNPGNPPNNGFTPQAGQCGSVNNQTVLAKPVANLCAYGTATVVRGDNSLTPGTGPWTWQCLGDPGMLQDSCVAALGGITTYDMTGANLAQIQADIVSAKQMFNSGNAAKENTTVVLKFPPGVFDYSQDTSVNNPVYCTPAILLAQGSCPHTQSIDFSNINPGPLGRLILYGSGMNETTLMFNPDQTHFYGKNLDRVSIVGLHSARDRYMTTQGTVVNPPGNPYPANAVVIDIPTGFPGLQAYPTGLNDPTGGGHVLAKFDSDGTTCHFDYNFNFTNAGPNVQPTNNDPGWQSASVIQIPGYPSRWQLTLNNQHGQPTLNPYANGDIVGVKADAGAGQTFQFYTATDIIMDEIEWTDFSRTIFSSSTNNPGDFTGYIQVLDSKVVREPPINNVPFCLATPSGGPQFGQPATNPTWGNLVDNTYIEGTGDDSIAIFNSSDALGQLGTTVSNSYITDSMGHSIRLNNSPYPVPNTIINTTEAYCFNPVPGPNSICVYLQVP